MIDLASLGAAQLILLLLAIGCVVWLMLWVVVGRAARPVLVAERNSYLAAVRAWLHRDSDRAELELRQALETRPHDPETMLWIGHLLRRRGRTQEALVVHRQVLARPTLDTSQRVHTLAACIADGLRGGIDPARLSAWTQDLLALDPDHPFGLNVHIAERRRANDLAAAFRAFRRLEGVRSRAGDRTAAPHGDARRPEHDRVIREALFLCRDGDRFVHCERWSEARRLFRTAMRLAEDHPAPHIGLGDVALAEGQEGAAIRHYRRALERGPDDLVAGRLARSSDELVVSVLDTLDLDLDVALADDSAWHCLECGHGAGAHGWSCPNCGAWDTLVAGEAMIATPDPFERVVISTP